MDLRLLKQVNHLWRKVYPYLADHIIECYGKERGDVLELGPFSGGISLELIKRYPKMEITVAAQDSEVIDLLKEEIKGAGLDERIEVTRSGLDPLVFADLAFDLVIFRGAYFFLDEEGNILREIYRVLRPDGLGFMGGGYGKDTPRAVIHEIADVSRDLNDRLGRIRVSVDDLRNMAKRAGLSTHAEIEKEGGLWLIIRK
ncbi:MAG: class I SAM-dependent methyltransferase [Thermodesulfobacteriota bacterium]